MGHYLDTDVDRARNGANVQRASQASEWGRRVCAEGPRGWGRQWAAKCFT